MNYSEAETFLLHMSLVNTLMIMETAVPCICLIYSKKARECESYEFEVLDT